MKRILVHSAVNILALFFCSHMMAQDLDAGLKAAQAGDFEEAHRQWEPLVKDGNAIAQFYMSTMYERGDGVDQDLAIAIDLLEKSAKAGYQLAQYNLGTRYYNAEGVDQDFSKACNWFRLAAQQGLPFAQFSFGSCLHAGKGASLNLTEAVHWYQLAAENGNIPAAINLAAIKHTGPKELQDHKEAEKWWKFAAERDDLRAQFNLGLLYYHASDEIEQNYSKAFDWIEKSAKAGYLDAKTMLGIMYVSGNGVEASPSKGISLFEEAAVGGSPLAQYNLGLAYLYGDNIDRDFQKAEDWFKLSADSGYQLAKDQLSLMRDNGQIALKAAKSESTIKESEIPDSDEIIASKEVILQKAFSEKNYKESYEIALTLSQKSSAIAQLHLGKMFSEGLGTIQILTDAHMWFNIAAMSGSEEAFRERNALAERMSPETIVEAQKLAAACIKSEYTNCGFVQLSRNEKKNVKSISSDKLNSDFKNLSLLKRKQLQFALRELGFYASTIDGIWGPKTDTAFSNYQKSNDLSITTPDSLFSSLFEKVDVPSAFDISSGNTTRLSQKSADNNLATAYATQQLADSIDRMNQQREYEQGMQLLNNAQNILQSMTPPSTNRMRTCSTVSTGYLTGGLMTSCW